MIGSTYNFMSEIFIQLMSSFNQGEYDEARELQRKANLFVNLMENTTGMPEWKSSPITVPEITMVLISSCPSTIVFCV